MGQALEENEASPHTDCVLGHFGLAPQPAMTRLVDTFMFSEPHEADLLWLKLNMEDPLIQEWVVVENSYTLQGERKGHHLKNLIHEDPRFARFLPKIHLIECEIKGDGNVDRGRVFDDDAFEVERAQRESALEYLLSRYSDRDYVLISDVDECLDAQARRRRRLLQRKLTQGGDVILVPRIRFWFDYDNRGLGRRSVPVVSIAALRRHGGLSRHREESIWMPVVWKHEMVFEYSYCFSRDEIMRKFDTFAHTGFERDEVDMALDLNYRPVSRHRSRRLQWTHENWFVKRRLNPFNSPAFVREHLDELRTHAVSPDYAHNRIASFPEFFPKSRVRRACNWAKLYGGMYSSLLKHTSPAYAKCFRRLERLADRVAPRSTRGTTP